MKNLHDNRREYGKRELREENLSPNPFIQFEGWLKEALETEILDPTAMVLATVDEKGGPDTRVVLLKQFDHHGLVFFTHYESPKAMQAQQSGKAAVNFYWPPFARQIRIKGEIERTSRRDSETYFSSRSKESQICALASQQSACIANRQALEKRFEEISSQYEGKPVICPENWGGYRILPTEFEFFQGRDNRLHDRIRYLKVNQDWKIERLSP